MPQKQTADTKQRDFTEKIWSFFTSLRLVIFLLLVLSVLSVLGTVIEQNKPLYEYYRFFRPETVAFFKSIGLLDMYHSWWFMSFLALLALNLIACTMDRSAPIMAAMRKKNLLLDEKLSKSLNPQAKIKYALPLETVEKNMLSLVEKNFTRNHVITKAEDGSTHYFFEKGRYSRMAFFLTHASVLIIFIGAIVGSFFGYKGYVNIFEGQSVSRVETRDGKFRNLGFAVRCDSFNVDFYNNGMPRDFRSDLAVVQGGREMVRKTIRVNDPLTFSGITFYQSSYGSLPDAAVIEVRGKDGLLKGEVTAPYGKTVDVPGGGKIEVADYQQDHHLPDGSEAGPALGVNVYPEKGEAAGIWLLQRYSDYDKLRGGDSYLVIKDLRLKKYTGLQVNKDPGEWLVWLGCVLLIAGIMTAFFMSHKKLWISLQKDKKGRTELTVGGTTNRNRAAFVLEAEKIIQSLREVSR